MISPVDFLNARYDEIQALAERAGGKTWHVAHDAYDPEDSRCTAGECWHRRIEGDDITIYDEGGHDEEQAAHIARHNPANVLADIAVKRAFVAEYVRRRAETFATRDDDLYGGGYADALGYIVLALARVFKAHPDFDPTWSVDQ